MHKFICRWNFIFIASGSGAIGIQCFKAAILDYPLPVRLYSIRTSPIGMLDPKNIGVAVGISLIYCLEAEIHAFDVWRPPSWIFPLLVRSHSLPIGTSGLLDP